MTFSKMVLSESDLQTYLIYKNIIYKDIKTYIDL